MAVHANTERKRTVFNLEKRFHTHKDLKKDQPAKAEYAEENLQTETVMQEAAVPEETIHREDFFLPEMKGELLELWRLWAEDQLPPILSLTNGIEPERLQMTESGRERQKVRLTVKLIQDAKNRVKEIETLKKNSDEANLPAKCCCYIADNKMVAWLFAFPPVGTGEKLTSEALGNVLEGNGIKSGIEAKSIVKMLQDPHYFELVPIAFGIPPVQGKDGAIHENFKRKIECEILVDENGNADYRSVSYVQNVDKGDVICTIESPSPGTDGLGVDGNVVPARAVKEAAVPQGANTQVSEDGLSLIASQSGHLEYANNVFRIRPVLEIEKDVDYSTGNIDFIGDVHIHGDVRENFMVQAKGTIIIDGLVEAATTIIAGGDLLIASGVVGDNRAVLQSAGNVRAKYLESCDVYAGRNVYAECIVASRINCDGSIIVTTGRGSIIGGNLTAAVAVRAKMIGARSGRQTEIVLGEQPYAEIGLKKLKQEIAEVQDERKSLQEKLEDMERCGIGGERAAKAKIRKVALEVKLEKLEKSKEQMKAQKPELHDCMVSCDVMYPITRITMGKYTGQISDVKKQYRVKYGEDISQETNDERLVF